MPWRPEFPGERPTLGWYVLDWASENLLAPDRPADEVPLAFSREQAEFVLRFYELDPVTGVRVRRRGVISRPRGWGKSPMVAALCLVEALGDVVPDGWDADGRPVGKPWWTVKNPNVWVAAATEDQTEFTWEPLLEMASGPVVDNYPGVEPMESMVALPGGRGRIKFVPASGRSAKGGKPVFCSMDQTETWYRSNGGFLLRDAILNNLAKRAGSVVETPNAFTPEAEGQESVAQATAEACIAIQEGRARKDTGLIWDHREAPPETDLTDEASLTYGLRVAYGCSSDHPDGCVLHEPACAPGWAPIESYKARIWDPDADEQVSRADFLNQITHASNSWIAGPEWRACEASVRVADRDVVVLGFDGSRGRVDGKPDATALIGCRVADGHLFKVGVWEAPDVKSEWPVWVPPIAEIEAVLADAFKRFRVVGLYGDPAKGWDAHLNAWEATYGPRLPDRAARASRQHPFSWWMTGGRTGLIERMVLSLERSVRNSAKAKADGRPLDLTHSGDVDLTRHVLNARRSVRSGKLTIAKESARSVKKIDAAVAACLAWQARLDAVAAGVGKVEQPATVGFGRIY